jgi:uncharacterized membrane protein
MKVDRHCLHALHCRTSGAATTFVGEVGVLQQCVLKYTFVEVSRCTYETLTLLLKILLAVVCVGDKEVLGSSIVCELTQLACLVYVVRGMQRGPATLFIYHITTLFVLQLTSHNTLHENWGELKQQIHQ